MKKSLTKLETASVTYFLLRACFMGISLKLILNTAKQSSYLSISLGFIIGFLPLFLYLLILKRKKEKNLHEYITFTFGKMLGTVIEIIFFCFTLFYLSYLYHEFTRFIQIEYLSKTPRLLIFFVFLIPLFYLVRKGINVIGRVSLILLYLSIIIIFITFSSLIFQMNPSNLLPILKPGKELLNSTSLYIGFNILPLFLLTVLPYHKEEQHTKFIFWTYVLGSIALIITTFLTIAILGFDLASTYTYPEFHLLKQVSVIGVLGHIESILAIQGIFDFFMILTIGFYFLTTFFHFKYTISLIFITFLITYFLFPTLDTSFILRGTYLIYFILPIILYLVSLLKKDKQKK